MEQADSAIANLEGQLEEAISQLQHAQDATKVLLQRYVETFGLANRIACMGESITAMFPCLT